MFLLAIGNERVELKEEKEKKKNSPRIVRHPNSMYSRRREKALLDNIQYYSLGPSLSLSSMLRYLVARRYTKFLSKLIT